MNLIGLCFGVYFVSMLLAKDLFAQEQIRIGLRGGMGNNKVEFSNNSFRLQGGNQDYTILEKDGSASDNRTLIYGLTGNVDFKKGFSFGVTFDQVKQSFSFKDIGLAVPSNGQFEPKVSVTRRATQFGLVGTKYFRVIKYVYPFVSFGLNTQFAKGEDVASEVKDNVTLVEHTAKATSSFKGTVLYLVPGAGVRLNPTPKISVLLGMDYYLMGKESVKGNYEYNNLVFQSINNRPYYTSEYQFDGRGLVFTVGATYRIWTKKPKAPKSEPVKEEPTVLRDTVVKEVEKIVVKRDTVVVKEKPAEAGVNFSGKVKDSNSGEPLIASIVISELGKEAVLAEVQTDGEGFFRTKLLPLGKKYAIRASTKGYLEASDNYTAIGITGSKEVLINFSLEKIKVGAKVKINNISFETGKAKLTEESYQELRKIATFLKENPTLKVELSGHTDNTGSDAINTKLSKERADAVKNFLLQEGIDPTKITAKGYGSQQPVGSNDTEAGRQENRRVEFKILGME